MRPSRIPPLISGLSRQEIREPALLLTGEHLRLLGAFAGEEYGRPIATRHSLALASRTTSDYGLFR
jgi:hypothetical protein